MPGHIRIPSTFSLRCTIPHPGITFFSTSHTRTPSLGKTHTPIYTPVSRMEQDAVPPFHSNFSTSVANPLGAAKALPAPSPQCFRKGLYSTNPEHMRLPWHSTCVRTHLKGFQHSNSPWRSTTKNNPAQICLAT